MKKYIYAQYYIYISLFKQKIIEKDFIQISENAMDKNDKDNENTSELKV